MANYENWVLAMHQAIDDETLIPEFEQNPREALEFFRQAILDRRDRVKYDVIDHVRMYPFVEPVTMSIMVDAFARLKDRELLSHAGQIVIIEWTCEPDRDYRGYPLLVLDMLRLVRHSLYKTVEDGGITLGDFLVRQGVFRQIFEVLVSGEDFGKKVLYAAAEQLTESSDTDSMEHLGIIRQLLENHKDSKVRDIFEKYYGWLATRDPMGDFLAEIERKARARGISEKEVKNTLRQAIKNYKALFGAYNLVKQDLDSQNDLVEDDDQN